jgi:hypothetical protein
MIYFLLESRLSVSLLGRVILKVAARKKPVKEVIRYALIFTEDSRVERQPKQRSKECGREICDRITTQPVAERNK